MASANPNGQSPADSYVASHTPTNYIVTSNNLMLLQCLSESNRFSVMPPGTVFNSDRRRRAGSHSCPFAQALIAALNGTTSTSKFFTSSLGVDTEVHSTQPPKRACGPQIPTGPKVPKLHIYVLFGPPVNGQILQIPVEDVVHETYIIKLSTSIKPHN